MLIEFRTVPGTRLYRFYQDDSRGLAIIVGEDGTFLLANAPTRPTSVTPATSTRIW